MPGIEVDGDGIPNLLNTLGQTAGIIQPTTPRHCRVRWARSFVVFVCAAMRYLEMVHRSGTRAELISLLSPLLRLLLKLLLFPE